MKKIFLFAMTGLLSAGFCFSQTTPQKLPATITFDHQVKQKMNGEDGASTTTYWFTTNGDYAMAEHEEPGEEKATVLYTKDGQMCMINKKNKTITVMKMLKIVGEGAQMGKEVAEKINKKPLKKDDKDVITATKTGKTKTICGFTSYEYQVKSDGGSSSWWYAKVDFDPVLIYTMGAGKLGNMDAIKNKKELSNNPFAIPLQNPNYFFAEIEVGGKKGMETTGISKTTNSFSTEGYKIKFISGLKDAIQKKDDK